MCNCNRLSTAVLMPNARTTLLCKTCSCAVIAFEIWFDLMSVAWFHGLHITTQPVVITDYRHRLPLYSHAVKSTFSGDIPGDIPSCDDGCAVLRWKTKELSRDNLTRSPPIGWVGRNAATF